MDGARVAGATMRRRERRLHSWAKHERMTVAMALAENLHQSRQKVEGGEHECRRAQKTARATGARPGVLKEPEPQGGAVTDGYVAALVPSLATLVLAGMAGEAVDRTALSYLLQQSLAARMEEEERKLVELEVKRKEAELQPLAAATKAVVQQRAIGSSSWTSALARSDQLRRELKELRGEKRKKRKKRKNKLPKTSSGYERPCDHHRRVPAVRSSDPVYPVVAQRQAPTVHALQLQVQFLDRFLTCPLWCFDKCMVRWCRKLWFSRSCSPSLAVDFSFALQRLSMVQTVQQIIETPQSQFVFLVVDPCCAGRADSSVPPWRRRSRFHSCSSTTGSGVQTVGNCGKSAVAVHRWSSIFLSWCRGRFPWSYCSADHGDSTVAVLERGDRCPWYAGRGGSSSRLLVVCNDRCPPQLQFINKVALFPFVEKRHIR